MKSIDADNLKKLQEIYDNTPEIQITKSFQLDSKSSDNNARANDN